METPYRNNLLFNDLINLLSNSTKLCVATNISLKSEKIKSMTVYSWRKTIKEDLNKKPSIFIINSEF